MRLEEPNNPTTNSLAFRLTATRHELAGNGRYYGSGVLSNLLGQPAGLPKSLLAGRFGRARLRVSAEDARLVNGAGVRPRCFWR